MQNALIVASDLPPINFNKDNNFNLMRFVAASMVLISHSFVLSSGSANVEPLLDILGMTLGNIAVDIFFVVSGFLVTQSLIKRRNLIDFILARVLRIYPGLIVSIIFCVFIVGAYCTTLSIQSYFSSHETYRFLFKNSSLIFGLEDTLPGVFDNNPWKGAVNGSLWTLPLEVKMYAILASIGVILLGTSKWVGRDFFRHVIVAIACIAMMANIANHFSLFMNRRLLYLFTLFFVGSAFYLLNDKIIKSNKTALIMFSTITLSIFISRDAFFVSYTVCIAYLVIHMAPAVPVLG